MPELPEVQTVVNDLQILTGDIIIGFWTNFEKAIKSNNFKNEIIEKKILSIKRLGKNIVIKLNNSTFIIAHLKMTGKLLLMEHGAWSMKQNTDKHIHHVFSLKNNGFLVFSDIRKFATLELISSTRLSEITMSKGMDPFDENFTLENFTKIITSKKNKNVKSVLMDQSLISGIGNIYASEIPYHAKINPLRTIDSLSKNETKALYSFTLKILSKAIKLRGTSISDYRDAKGHKGSFQNHLIVYGKAGRKCTKCATIIVKNIVEQRSTFHCPNCQH